MKKEAKLRRLAQEAEREFDNIATTGHVENFMAASNRLGHELGFSTVLDMLDDLKGANERFHALCETLRLEYPEVAKELELDE